MLLPWLVGSLPPQAARDYPVYLPHGSPTVSWESRGAPGTGPRKDHEAGTRGGGASAGRGGAPASPCCAPLQVPHRLLTLTLLPGLELCLLCGPRPPLSQLDPQVNPGHVPALPASNTLCPPAPSLAHHLSRPAFSTPHSPFVGPGPRGLHLPAARSLYRSHSLLAGFTLSLVPWVLRVPCPRGLLLSTLATPPPRYPPLTSPTGLASAFGPLVAAGAGPAAGLRAAGIPSAARWLPPAHGHPRVGLGRGCGLGVLTPSAPATTPPFLTGCCCSTWN